LRELRRKKGLTLQQCEEISGGELKAVVLGSYERGHRAISLARLQKLSDFYGVPVEYFFNSNLPTGEIKSDRLIFDIRRVQKFTDPTSKLETVKSYLASITAHRRDWNGEVLSLRAVDSELLSLLTQLPLNELYQELRLAGFLFASEVSGQPNL
jgi:transcriptional regulator with XRE-family HTH domain